MGGEGIIFTEIFLSVHAVNAVPTSATAYVHRSSSADLEVGAIMLSPERVGEFNEFFDQLYNTVILPNFAASDGSFEVYQNTGWHSLEDPQLHYYGSNYPRLQQVKKMYDPEVYWSFEQGIEPAA